MDRVRQSRHEVPRVRSGGRTIAETVAPPALLGDDGQVTRRPDSPPGPYGRWDLELVSVAPSRLTPIARASADAAHEQFAIPGLIHDQLRPEVLTVTPTAVTLQFQWKQNPSRFAVTSELPRSEDDLRAPADSPQAWASVTAVEWWENLSTGWTRWGRGRRRNGVIQLGRQTLDPPNGDYVPGGRLQLAPHPDGQIRVPSGPGSTVNTAAFPADRFISCTYEVRTPGVYGSHSSHGPLVIIVWTADPGVAKLEMIGTQTGVPDYSTRRAALSAIHDAADAGAYKIVTTSTAPILTDLGFVNHAHGQRALDVLVMP